MIMRIRSLFESDQASKIKPDPCNSIAPVVKCNHTKHRRRLHEKEIRHKRTTLKRPVRVTNPLYRRRVGHVRQWGVYKMRIKIKKVISVKFIPSDYYVEWCVWKRPYLRIVGTWVEL